MTAKQEERLGAVLLYPRVLPLLTLTSVGWPCLNSHLPRASLFCLPSSAPSSAVLNSSCYS